MKAPGLQVIRGIQVGQDIEIRAEKQDLRISPDLTKSVFISIQRQKKGGRTSSPKKLFLDDIF